MTRPPDNDRAHQPPETGDGVSDVLAEDEVVHVPAAVADLVGSIEHHGETFVADVPDWDAPDGAA